VRLDSIFRLLFIVYCLEAGIFLLLTPWTDGWSRLLVVAPLGALRPLLASSWVRGLITGFGALHLVWAVHDIDLVFRGEPASPSDGERSPAARGQ